MKEIVLPRQINGQPPPTLQGRRQVTVVGANGSGKTRFINEIAHNLGDGAFRVSALNALFDIGAREHVPMSIESLYRSAVENVQFMRPSADTEFEMLLFLLLNDEMAGLFAYKMDLLSDDPQKPPELPRTKIDKVVRLWQEIFPKNEVLRANGRIRIRNQNGDSPYKPLQLSNGEKAVFYYIGAALYAPEGSVVIVESPTMFLHPSITQSLWTAIEGLRPDCTFLYLTHDVDFVTSRTDNLTVWVRGCNVEANAWDYELLKPHESLSEQLIIDLAGSRKPVLFVEGDDTHSLDCRLYSLVFPEYTVKSMGSCNKVIETVRSFNDMSNLHHLDSYGIVDRDRRNDKEVEYLREKKIRVPDVAEIENMFLLEPVVRTMARRRGKDASDAFGRIRANVLRLFKQELRQQALLHTRHHVKRMVEVVIDRKFPNINALEQHVQDIVEQIAPRKAYDQLCSRFNEYVRKGDYRSVLKVFNQKSMLNDSELAVLCGYTRKEDYINAVFNVLKGNGRDAATLREAIRGCFDDEAVDS